jgi:hypothetical protein
MARCHGIERATHQERQTGHLINRGEPAARAALAGRRVVSQGRTCMRSALVVALCCASHVSLAAPIEALEPMAFLAGHCWKGTFPGSSTTDEHCFSWLYDGKALRDVHTVRTPGRPDYVGETTYYWDASTKRVEFLYVENQGGISRGTMEPTAEALVFPATQFVERGSAMTYRVRWTRVGDDAYEAWSEMQDGSAWKTMFRLTLKRVS